MIRTYLSRFLLPLVDDVQVKRIYKEFKKYKEERDPGTLFGRDEPLDRPMSAKLANLKHVHLLEPKDVQMAMAKKGVRAIRLMDQFDMKSDAFLIYCQGMADKNNYLLIDLLWLDAHRKTNEVQRMIDYAEEAERFYKSGK